MDMSWLASVHVRHCHRCRGHLCGIRNTIGMRGCNLLIDDLRARANCTPRHRPPTVMP